MPDMAWWLDLATFLGIAVLAVPVWSLDLRKQRLARVADAERTATSDSAFRKAAREILTEKHRDNVARWRPLDRACLLVGYALLLGAALLRLLFPGPPVA